MRRAGGVIDYCTIFLASWIVLSIWLGYAGLLSPVAGILSLGVSYLINARMPPLASHYSMRNTFLSFGGVLLVMGIIFWGIQGGYDLSADAAPSVATAVVTQSIPPTYTPYFDVPLFYQMGLPAVASQLVALGISPHLALWLFALVGGVGLIFIGMIRLAQKTSVNPLFLYWVPILLLGTRLPYYNLLLGEYPWLVGMGLGLMAVTLFSRSWVAGTIVLAAAGLAHPYIGLFSALVWLLVDKPSLREMGNVSLAGALLVFPLVGGTIIPFSSLARVPTLSVDTFSAASVVANSMLVGIIPVLLSLGLCAKKIINRETWTRSEILFLVLGVSALVLSALVDAWAPELVMGTKLLTLSVIGMVITGAYFLSQQVKRTHYAVVTLILIALSILALFSSPSMHSYILGSKSTLDEALAADALREYDERVVPVLFLSEGIGKMAQYSQKIPLDPRGAHFMLALQLLDTPHARALKQQSADFRTLLESDCVPCVDEFLAKYPAEYVVVNQDDFPLLSKEIMMKNGKFIVYTT